MCSCGEQVDEFVVYLDHLERVSGKLNDFETAFADVKDLYELMEKQAVRYDVLVLYWKESACALCIVPRMIALLSSQIPVPPDEMKFYKNQTVNTFKELRETHSFSEDTRDDSSVCNRAVMIVLFFFVFGCCGHVCSLHNARCVVLCVLSK